MVRPPSSRDASAARAITWLSTEASTPVRLWAPPSAMSRQKSAIRPKSPPPWPEYAPSSWWRSITSSGWPNRRR